MVQADYGDNIYTVPYANWRAAMLANAQRAGGTASNQGQFSFI